MKFAWVLIPAALFGWQDRAERLPDFSYAGYRAGEVEPPDREATVNVKDFGAVGDGKTDDTKAFQDALAEAAKKGATVRVPEGRWVISGVLEIGTSGMGIKGAGSGKSVLVCPKSMADMFGADKSWSWSGGIIRVRPGTGAARRLGRIRRAKAGDREVEMEGEAPKAGEWLELSWHNDKGKDTLLDYLYGGVIPSKSMGDELKAAEGPRVRE